jgi:5-methylcytosine-specific restriction endonuclease McrA
VYRRNGILKGEVLKRVAINLLGKNKSEAIKIIQEDYPFVHLEREKRTYSDKQKIKQFIKDGFIDRYSGQRLVNPGLLKVISCYLPEVFPYHPHWKMDECHNAYWELIPTVDHIHPIALGGTDSEENYATTSMLHNSIKNNWTLEQLQWSLYPAGDYTDWDGLTGLFIKLVEQDKELLKDAYIKRWYALSIASDK